jgi:hypothetical protein
LVEKALILNDQIVFLKVCIILIVEEEEVGEVGILQNLISEIDLYEFELESQIRVILEVGVEIMSN